MQLRPLLLTAPQKLGHARTGPAGSQQRQTLSNEIQNDHILSLLQYSAYRLNGHHKGSVFTAYPLHGLAIRLYLLSMCLTWEDAQNTLIK